MERAEKGAEGKKHELQILITEIDKELSRLNPDEDAEKIQRWQEQREKISAEIEKLTE